MSRKKPTFPHRHEKNGRTGKVYKIGDGRFKTHFKFGGKYRQKIFSTFDDALGHLDQEFSTVDTDLANSESEFPLERDRKHYYELDVTSVI